MTRTLSLVVRNVVFTLVVPGLGGVWLPWWLLTREGGTPTPTAWEAVPVIAAGAALYVWCAWNFAAVGRGTPGPWDAPRRVVARGPYRWVRNPIYLAALLVVLGEAWLFASLRLLVYAAAMAFCFHLFVAGYEERDAGPPLRARLPGVPARGPALDPPRPRPGRRGQRAAPPAPGSHGSDGRPTAG